TVFSAATHDAGRGLAREVVVGQWAAGRCGRQRVRDAMPCSFCGHTNPSRGRFCLECGRSLALRCRCQADLPATAKFCPECGTPAAHTDGAPEPRTPTP